MNALNFCYWLQGYLELTERGKPLTSKQVHIIQQHMALVLTNITSHGPGTIPSPFADLESGTLESGTIEKYCASELPSPRIAGTC